VGATGESPDRAGDAPAPDVETLARALHDADGAVRDRAARALGDRREPDAIPALAAAIDAGRGGRGAVWALTQFDDPRLVAPLASALSDPDATARALAAGKLAGLGDRGAVPALVAALRDSDPHVREEAARALGRLGDPTALDPLLDALQSDAGDHVREEAATAVGTLGAADRRAADLLLAALGDRHVMVRRAAAEALVALGAGAQARLRDHLATGPATPGHEEALRALAARPPGAPKR
jgi:HEAT repeat protein